MAIVQRSTDFRRSTRRRLLVGSNGIVIKRRNAQVIGSNSIAGSSRISVFELPTSSTTPPLGHPWGTVQTVRLCQLPGRSLVEFPPFAGSDEDRRGEATYDRRVGTQAAPRAVRFPKFCITRTLRYGGTPDQAVT